MFLDASFDTVRTALGQPKLARHDEVVPDTLPVLSHHPYVDEYGWLFSYERQLARFLDHWTGAHRQELVGKRGLLSEALSNAYCHGNGRAKAAVISVKVFVGERGLMVQVSDHGVGFRVDEITACASRGGKSYYANAGNGMRRMIESETFGIFFDDGGRSFQLVFFFEGASAMLRALGGHRHDAPVPPRGRPQDRDPPFQE